MFNQWLVEVLYLRLEGKFASNRGECSIISDLYLFNLFNLARLLSVPSLLHLHDMVLETLYRWCHDELAARLDCLFSDSAVLRGVACTADLNFYRLSQGRALLRGNRLRRLS